MLHPVKGAKMTTKGHKPSAKAHMEAGSGSRPVMSKHAIDTSAPAHPHHLDRNPKSPMK